ncbi:lipopolysaccharide biosynthesis protein, partial [Desulfobotulus sp.]|uniref:lipopolysaccharide biosynthesis protein n=1 Tax=Desulfobotulus sp. TaxID=1940337 RepID=UPI002A35E3DD
MASTAAGQLLLIAATPLLTRLYAPDDFGVFGVFWAMISVVAVISSLRYEIAIPLPPRDLNARHLLVLALIINAIVAILAFFTVLLLHDPIVRWTGAPGLATCLWLLPPGLLFVGSYKAFNYWAIRNRDYTRIGKTRILQSCTNVSVQLGAGFMGAGAVGMVSGQLLGQIMGISSLAR